MAFRIPTLAIGLLSALCLPAATAAEAGRTRPAPLEVAHVDSQAPRKIDGVLDEALWQQATRFELAFETRPAENTPASVKTTVYLAENGEHLLVAFLAEDPDPSQIRAFLRDRDSAYQDDFVGFTLDTFDDERRAYEFFANPLGVQMDLIMDDQNGNEDDSWDGLWDSAGRITDTGYVVEFEIPFSTLRFQSSADVQQWGADFLRFRPRDVRQRISANRIDRAIPCYLCQVGRIRGFAGIHAGSNLEITPTLTATFGQSRGEPGAPFESEGLKFDPGVDIKWGLSPNVTLAATLNPDFSQVEADSAQLDVNNTFALFYQEKRPFFLEGADYFASPNTLVYTRNVVDPDIGLRVTGRSGPQTYGVFVARDTVTNLLLPGVTGSSLGSYEGASNAGAFRYRYDLGKALSLGALATVRRGDDYENSVGAVDGRWQKGSHTLTAQLMDTRTRDPGGDAFAGRAYTAEYQYATREWFVFADRSRFDDGFRADLGFIGQVGFQQDTLGVTRHWWNDGDALFNHITANVRWWDSRRTDGGDLLEITRDAWVGVNGAMQSYYELGHLHRHREWNGVRFDERINRIRAELTPVRGLELGLFARHGTKVDLANTRLGKLTTINPSVTWNLGRSALLSLNHNYERLARDGGDVYLAHLTDLRLSYQFNLRQRLRLAVVRSDMRMDPDLATGEPCELPGGYCLPPRGRSTSTQLIYSYKINPRTALYAGYTDGYFSGDVDTDYSPDVPGSDDIDTHWRSFQTGRALFVKIGYAWMK